MHSQLARLYETHPCPTAILEDQQMSTLHTSQRSRTYRLGLFTLNKTQFSSDAGSLKAFELELGGPDTESRLVGAEVFDPYLQG